MNDKAKNVLSYVFPIVGFIFLCLKDSSKNVKFIGAQATTLWLLYFLISLVYKIMPFYLPMFTMILRIGYTLLLVYGIVKVCNNDKLEIPIISDITKGLFAKLLNK